MNTYNAHEFRTLLNALADGKTIQFKDDWGWVDLAGEIGFTFSPEDYRIKPETVIWDANSEDESEEDGDCTYKYCELAERFAELLESHCALKEDYAEFRAAFYDKYCEALERIASLEDNIERIKEVNDEVCENVYQTLSKLHM